MTTTSEPQQRQAILNEHCPPRPEDIPNHPRPIPVRMRLVFADDGEKYLSGNALRWTNEHVYVEPDPYDPRFPTDGVWLKALDVYQREPRELPPK